MKIKKCLGFLLFAFLFVPSSKASGDFIVLLQNKVAIPSTFWERVEIRVVEEKPYYSPAEGKLVLADGRVVNEESNTGELVPVIELNAYFFQLKAHTEEQKLDRFKETLAHETGHILYGNALGEKAFDLKQEFERLLGDAFSAEKCFSDGGKAKRHCSLSPWGYRPEEAFADLVRILFCATCKRKPDTNIEEMGDRLTAVVKEIVALGIDPPPDYKWYAAQNAF